MTERFPKLKDNEVALARADVNTGHALDEDFKLAIDEKQKIYTIFDSLEKAINFAKSIIRENKSIECNIFGADEKFLKRISIYEH